ncbi:bis(5'-adenosyl)-triphosphatase ENPP4-like [Cylas formicarius]|uniref:bis(5'-adenosyl)-triphosphatase ENPP4-like n=1 Tax=Cylas formicarius TaxID=197179 RepID=UPI002958A773|nr:bis(5'-adenosyl)-triphosphatase ENPP4-like [Cylas formicarius]
MFLQLISYSLLICSVRGVSKHPAVIVVSYDGFRYDYVDTEDLPYLKLFRQQGVYAERLQNVFPTKTFPNHHSIATGLYPESHGVIGNSYFDSAKNKVEKIGYDMFHYNEEVVPIWRWNEDAEDGRHSGSMMWPGGDYSYQGKNITYTKSFQVGYDWHKRVDTTVEWILNPEKPANLVMLYFEEPDNHDHAFGPSSATIKKMLKKLDNITGYLQQKLHDNDLLDKVNVVHLSDHGMTGVTPPHFVNITQYMKNGTYEWAGASPAIQITPHTGFEDSIYEALEAGSKKNGHFKVYRKSEYLDRWHYKNNSRSPPILVMADPGYALDDLIVNAPLYARHYNFTLTNSSEFGVHGYDYTVDDMRPFFMAKGPSIPAQKKIETIKVVDLFNLFCRLLGLPPTANNGTTAAILTASGGKYKAGTILMISVGGVLIVLVLVTLAIVFTLVAIRRQQNITTAAALNKRFPQSFQNYVEAQHLLEPEDA